MALRTPPSWLQNGLHPAENDRLTMQAIWATTGIIGTSSLVVGPDTPAAMRVVVSEGWGVIVGDYQPNMGVYNFYNDGNTVLNISTADPTNPRIDKIVVTIQDAYYTGSANNVLFQVITGTPASSPVAPATPVMSMAIATVTVGAAVTQINAGNITDVRTLATTQLPIGDITEIQAGTGITVTNGTGPIPTIAVSSSTLTQTNTVSGITNKTFTAPKITSGSFIADSNGNELILFPSAVASAVNELTVSNAATGNSPSIAASGGDTNIDVTLTPKGTGSVKFSGDLQQTGTNGVGSIPDYLTLLMMGAL